ncbi:MAG: hypothetical protein OES57_15840 [Acidimicrobiia bacterium]|nr:hypothetical protein [Acidimicrobiia bacterium]
MSLWTPGGEHPVGDEPTGSPAPAEEPSLDDLTPEQQEQARAMAAEMADVQQRIAEAPAADVIANHVMGFYELAAIHLSQDTPNFEQAQVAIDAMSAVVDGLQGRLGEAETTLRDGRSQIQMAFVQLQAQANEGRDDTAV